MLVNQSKPCTHTYIFANNLKLHKFATTNNIFLKIESPTCIIVKRTCISIFSRIELVDQSKPCLKICLHKTASCINLQLPIVIVKKSIFLDIHHHKTYMSINFQQNRVNRSVIIEHTNLFAKNRKLHKFATTNSNF